MLLKISRQPRRPWASPPVPAFEADGHGQVVHDLAGNFSAACGSSCNCTATAADSDERPSSRWQASARVTGIAWMFAVIPPGGAPGARGHAAVCRRGLRRDAIKPLPQRSCHRYWPPFVPRLAVRGLPAPSGSHDRTKSEEILPKPRAGGGPDLRRHLPSIPHRIAQRRIGELKSRLCALVRRGGPARLPGI
jgi:hypothetical protein